MTRRTVPALLVLACCAALLVPGPAAAQTTPYDQQLDHANAIFRITAPGNAGAQEFTSDAETIDLVSVWLRNEAAHGQLRAQIRSDIADPDTARGTSTIDISDLGGWGQGWVEFRFDVPVAADPGSVLYLVVEAIGADGNVVWNGVRRDLPGALPSWNYDLAFWGGWQRYDDTTPYATTHLAFAVQPGPESRCEAIGGCYAATPRPPAELHWEGLLSNDTTVIGLDAAAAAGTEFVPWSDVLRLTDGSLRYLPDGASDPLTAPPDDPDALAAIAADRAWLASGSVPGRSDAEREVAARALLDMRALLQPSGAIAAAWWRIWAYAWPRDGSFAAAAFAHTGHADEAYRILSFFADVQRPDGTWEARYHLDGQPVLDGRHWQLDANGWIPWATWQWFQTAPKPQRLRQARSLYPMVAAAADYAAGSLQDDGLPEVTPDYWENAVDAPTIANSTALLSGLRAASDLAVELGRRHDARRWAAAAETLEAAIHREFGPYGYPRTPTPDSGADSLVTLLAPPFLPASPEGRAAIAHAADVLALPNGGILPGEDWRGDPFDAWTPETAMFALAAAASGREAEADHWLQWLYDHRTLLGSLPEKVRADGAPLSVAPLAWTDSIVVLSLVALDRPLPVPPDPCDGRPPEPLCRP